MNLDIKDTEVTEKDLNLIDKMNSSAKVNSKGIVLDARGNGLKGALSDYENGTFSQYDELLFIKLMKRRLYEYQAERFVYTGLPEELTPYRFENKVINKGSAVMLKVGETYWVLNYTVLTMNIYNEPVNIKIVEPLSSLNGNVYNINKHDFVILKNNNDNRVIFEDAYRWISDLEKILYQLEKNLTSSAPKGILNLKNTELAYESNGDSPMKDSMEKIVNGQDTFFVLRALSQDKQNVENENDDSIYIPMELTDRTETLIRNYTFIKEQIKELMGAEINVENPKKERAITGEVDTIQSVTNSTLRHAFNIRKMVLDRVNKTFGLNVTVELQEEDRKQITGGDNGEHMKPE